MFGAEFTDEFKRDAVAQVVDRGPPACFLPGPVCMRGGAARHFASDRHFHRRIEAEVT